jgi:cullin-associated NEDD8-dissociated protein 1
MQVGAFSVLKELVIVLPDCLADHFGSLVPGIEKALNVSEIHFVEMFLFR